MQITQRRIRGRRLTAATAATRGGSGGSSCLGAIRTGSGQKTATAAALLGARLCFPFVGPRAHSTSSRKLYKQPAIGTPRSSSPSPNPSPNLSPGPSCPLPLPLPCRTLVCPTNLLTNATQTSSTLSTTTISAISPLLSQSRFRLHSTTRAKLSPRTPIRLYSQQMASSNASPYEGKWTAQTVRKTFLDYFAERGHTIGTIRVISSVSASLLGRSPSHCARIHDNFLEAPLKASKSYSPFISQLTLCPNNSALLLRRPSQ